MMSVMKGRKKERGGEGIGALTAAAKSLMNGLVLRNCLREKEI